MDSIVEGLFLSCLLGSEVDGQRARRLSGFLSCLLGSEG